MIAPSGLIFGGWPMGGWHWSDVTEESAIRAAVVSAEAGVQWFDTAPVYGFGLGEERMGLALRRMPRPVYVMTKFGLRWDLPGGTFFFETDFQGKRYRVRRVLSPESIRLECEMSLKRLGVDAIDFYQLHWDDGEVSLPEVAGVLVRLKEGGKIRSWGVCNLNTGALHKLVQSGLKPAALQFAYSLLNRKPERALIPYCVKHNISFLAYSPLGRGLLTGNTRVNRQFEPGDDRCHWNAQRIDDINRKLASLSPLATRHGVTIPALILSWTLNQPGVSGVIAGARTPSQAMENVMAISFRPDADEMARISSLFGN